MKVFEITALTETFDVKKGVLDKDGKPMWNVIDKETGNVVKRYTGGGAEEDAVRDMDNRNAKIKDQEKSKKSTAQQTDQKEPVQKRSKNPVRNEPRLTDEPRTPKTTPPDSTNSKLRALHPEVPTVDELTTRERKKYAQGKSFTRRVKRTSGRGTVKITISPDMVDEQTRIKTGKVPPLRADDRRNPDDERPASKDRNPKPSRKGIIARLMDKLSSFAGSASKLGGGAIGSIVNAALTAVEVEEELDRMLRVVQNEIDRQRNAGVAEEDLTWTDAMESQYRECIDDLVELTFKGIIALLATAGATSLIVVGLASIIGSGGTSIILGLVAGGIIGFFGTEALYQVLEYAGVMDMVEDFIAKEWLKKSDILALAAGVDVIQSTVGGDDPWFGGDTKSEESIKESNKPNEKEVVDKLRDMITSNPELLAIYNKGKAKAKATKAALDQGQS